MDSVFGRLRSNSKVKRNHLAPSKEDILNTIDQFDKVNAEDCLPAANEDLQRCEDNNNLKSQLSEEVVRGRYDMLLDESPSASFSTSYSSEWERLFVTPNYKTKLKDHGIAGRLRSSRFRSVVWKIYLEVLPEDLDLWVASCHEWRSKYEELKNQLIVNPRKAVDQVDLSLNNPLSQDDESPWNKFFQDNELRLTIKQDVIRTFPELEFFKSSQLQDMMLDALFCFCRTHSVLSYKQGMHELLAPLIFILHCDHQAFLHASEVDTLQPISPNHRDIVKVIMDPKYLESDAYAMFCKVMETVEPWYLSKDLENPRPTDKVTSQPFSRPQDLNPSNVIVAKLTRIQDYILKKFDPELHQHLERLDIAPQVYGIRWVRLLFGREFPMQDLLAMWDAIFADGIGFDLVDYIFVAMLLYIRDVLLASDYVACLGCLMKFPPVGDVHYFIEKALYLREPNQYPRPPKYTFKTVNQPGANRSQHNKASLTNKRHNTGLGGFSSFSRKFNRPKTLAVSSKKISKSSSEPMNLQTDISPASPAVPEGKRGSTASLSQLEDSMFRTHHSSSSSLARLDPGHRSSQSTPAGHSPSGLSADEGAMPGFPHDSPSKYATLPSRTRLKNKKISKTDAEVQQQMSHLQGQLNDKSTMCRYCASKLDIHINRLQSELMKLNLDADDEIMLSLAGIKQVRDVLNGTLRFSQNLLDEDEIAISDNFYKEEERVTSERVENESAPNSAVARTLLLDPAVVTCSGGKRKHNNLFYMGSDETSETVDLVEPINGAAALSQSREWPLELNDYARKRHSSGPRGDHSGVSRGDYSNGPQQMSDSVLSDSLSVSSVNAQTSSTSTDSFEVSPNPLYSLTMDTDAV
ncbi:LOW QUALITY PROTEIN: TBC1 domain family member 5-like [Gigantopelta aegis]|uniref:LOW QUALITY PROTEIN: TBC1 domain family member 5-like n=1 Tax=Gigantopelta aegis TaxID=1735272 RepID=UPI001B888E3A|nr:LOW QUALITY PROTEIN: TBC1 domain family member 5-like [Gigantopelta aegis]